LLDVFLATDPFDWNALVGIGTIIAAFGSIGYVLITLIQARESNYLNFIKDMDQRLANQIEKELELKGYDDSIVYAYNYIDICDQIMFLIDNKKIPRSFYNYYLDFFNYSITIMWWYTAVYPEDTHSLKHSWPAITHWLVSNDMVHPYPIMHLPKTMQNEINKRNIVCENNEIHRRVRKSILDIKHGT
jgi:hypothetical protein